MKTPFIQTGKLIFLLLCVANLSCSNDSDDNKILNIDQHELTFQVGIDSMSFEITTSEEWTITSPELSQALGANNASTDWFEITPVFGTGNAIITIITKAESTNNSSVIYIKYGKQEKSVTLTQN